jgi:hypothetical protein
MANLRETLNTISGVDIGGNEFTLQDTDVQPYIDNPELENLEAQVIKARYGGSSINDPSPSNPMQGRASNVSGPAADQPRKIDFSRRGEFENHVFKQLKSENMPDGNPFNFNPNAALNRISKQDLPELFGNVFRNEVSWQDRHLLDDDQKKFWMNEVKRYRAHVETGLRSEREAAVNSYNQMMNSFDNAAKEQAATDKFEREKKKAIMEANLKAKERAKGRQDDYQKALAEHAKLLTQERELIADYLDAETAGTLTPERIDARLAELSAVKKQRQHLSSQIKSHEVPKPKGEATPVQAKVNPKKKEPAPEADADDKMVVRKKMPSRGSDKKPLMHNGKEVAKTGIVKKGPNKGRKKIIYTDGSSAYADEGK